MVVEESSVCGGGVGWSRLWWRLKERGSASGVDCAGGDGGGGQVSGGWVLGLWQR